MMTARAHRRNVHKRHQHQIDFLIWTKQPQGQTSQPGERSLLSSMTVYVRALVRLHHDMTRELSHVVSFVRGTWALYLYGSAPVQHRGQKSDLLITVGAQDMADVM